MLHLGSIGHVECLAAQDHRNKSLERDSKKPAGTYGRLETAVIDTQHFTHTATFHSCTVRTIVLSD